MCTSKLVALYHAPSAANDTAVHRKRSAESFVGCRSHIVKETLELILPIGIQSSNGSSNILRQLLCVLSRNASLGLVGIGFKLYVTTFKEMDVTANLSLRSYAL